MSRTIHRLKTHQGGHTCREIGNMPSSQVRKLSAKRSCTAPKPTQARTTTPQTLSHRDIDSSHHYAVLRRTHCHSWGRRSPGCPVLRDFVATLSRPLQYLPDLTITPEAGSRFPRARGAHGHRARVGISKHASLGWKPPTLLPPTCPPVIAVTDSTMRAGS